MTDSVFSSLERTWPAEAVRRRIRLRNSRRWAFVRAALQARYPGRKLSEIPELKEEVRSLLLEGRTVEEVSVVFGITGARARQWVAEMFSADALQAIKDTVRQMQEAEARVLLQQELEARQAHKESVRDGDVAALQDYVETYGTVPPITELLAFLGVYHQALAARWPEGWDALYARAGYVRADARGEWRKGKALSPEHRAKIAEGVRRRWAERKTQGVDAPKEQQ